MSAEFPTEAERLREAIRSVELWIYPVPMALTDALVERIEPLIRAREAAARAEAWDEGYDRGHEAARAVNPEWPDQPTNPYRQEADQ